MISEAYRNALEIPSVFLPRATVDATFLPWLWASVNMGRGTEIISAFGGKDGVWQSPRDDRWRPNINHRGKSSDFFAEEHEAIGPIWFCRRLAFAQKAFEAFSSSWANLLEVTRVLYDVAALKNALDCTRESPSRPLCLCKNFHAAAKEL